VKPERVGKITDNEKHEREEGAMKWSVISAVNNEGVLRSCLLKSPDIQSAAEVILQTGYSSAAAAYNSAIQKASTDLLVFVHQDVYLPSGWADALQRAVERLSTQDPNWGILGVWGVTKSNDRAGYLYWTGLDGTAGEPFDSPEEVTSLDEVLLILRKSSGLRFDEHLPGFHLYGADISLEARRRGMKCYAVSAFCVHNTNEYNFLPFEFWTSYLLIRRKWKTELPIRTPCAEITYSCWPMIRWNAIRAANILLGRHKSAKRVEDPSQLYQQLISSGLVNPLAPRA
jgi:hypothetical protein